MPGSITTTTISIPRRSSTARSSAHARTRIVSIRSITCVAPASRSAAAASSARSEEHTSELQSLMRISYAVFCLKKKTDTKTHTILTQYNTSPHTVDSVLEQNHTNTTNSRNSKYN